jgi:protein-S-isoprenylcysteine O-methyltransferase Ste14
LVPALAASPVTLPPSLLARAYVLGGAAVFVVALATGTWRFVTLGTAPASGPLGQGLLINALLFGVFAVHHSVLAREPVRARVSRAVSPPLERPTYVWVASLLFIATCLAWQPIAGTVYRIPPPWAWAVGALQLAGGVLTLDAARRIDIRVLAGLRPEPIYLGWVLLVWAASDMTTGRMVFAAISTTYLVIAVPFEERSLRRRFGPSYDGYCQMVRWRIVPGLY